jgi:hypothetical protein
MSSPVYKTKNGETIEFKKFPFKENTDERGFIVHHIYAYVGGEEAGYIKVSYVPLNLWTERMKSLWHFVNIFTGCCQLSGLSDNELYSDDMIWKKLIEPYGFLRGTDTFESTTAEERSSALKYARENYQNEYDQAYYWHVDKPLVDYIKVYGKYELDTGKSKKNFQRLGIGTALYKFAARWMAKEFGLKLYASGIQTLPAKCLWGKMYHSNRFSTGFENIPKKHSMAERVDRIFLDYRSKSHKEEDIIREEGEKVREWAENRCRISNLSGFCSICSAKLFLALQERGIDVDIVESDFHVWLESNGKIIDITATQYGTEFPPVFIVRKSMVKKGLNHWLEGESGLGNYLNSMDDWPSYQRPTRYKIPIKKWAKDRGYETA